jgi:methylphosphotriester-DNA--protein-cysteine methyltransferase
MISHEDIGPLFIFKKIKNKEIVFAGNRKLKIYGMLHCASGKRMKKENRVFFFNEQEAIENGYRPCGHCIRSDYDNWKRSILN